MIVYNAKNRITNGYSKNHRAVDIGWKRNYTEEQNYLVYPNCKGIVKEIQIGIPNDLGSTGKRSWGNYVLIEHENGMFSRYAHLKDVYCRVGEKVDENTSIGYMGNSGNAYGVHLHFEVQTAYSSSTRIDPTPYLTKKIVQNKEDEKTDSTIKVGDFVIVNGVGTANSFGGGAKTGVFQNRKMQVMKIVDLKRSNPYALNKNCDGKGVTGWFRKEDVKKV